MSKEKVQVFMSKMDNGWGMVGYKTELETHAQRYYWKHAHYIYNGKKFDVRVMNQCSVFPPNSKVLKMVSGYIEKHFSE